MPPAPNFQASFSGSGTSVVQAISPSAPINVGDTLFLALYTNAAGVTGSTSVSDSSGNQWNNLSSQSHLNGTNGNTYVVTTWSAVATAFVASGGSYNLMLSITTSSSWLFGLIGVSGIGTLLQTTLGTGAGTTGLAPPAISLTNPAFVIVAIQGTFTLAGSAGLGFNRVNTSSGFAQMDMFWAVFGANSNSAPSDTQSLSAAWVATQSAFNLTTYSYGWLGSDDSGGDWLPNNIYYFGPAYKGNPWVGQFPQPFVVYAGQLWPEPNVDTSTKGQVYPY